MNRGQPKSRRRPRVPLALWMALGIDAVLDMGRAGINVFGNTAAVLVVRRFGGLPEGTSATGEASALGLASQPSSSAA